MRIKIGLWIMFIWYWISSDFWLILTKKEIVILCEETMSAYKININGHNRRVFSVSASGSKLERSPMRLFNGPLQQCVLLKMMNNLELLSCQ